MESGQNGEMVFLILTVAKTFEVADAATDGIQNKGRKIEDGYSMEEGNGVRNSLAKQENQGTLTSSFIEQDR